MKTKKRLIPFFLDFYGTTDALFVDSDNIGGLFFKNIKDIEAKYNATVALWIISGSNVQSREIYKKFKNFLIKYQKLYLLKGCVSEYCGYYFKNGQKKNLHKLDERLKNKKGEIVKIAKNYGGYLNKETKTYVNVIFDDITESKLNEFSENVIKLFDESENNHIQYKNYFDEYGKECDFKPENHSKYFAVQILMNKLLKKYDCPFYLVGGDSLEDLEMFTKNIKFSFDNNLTLYMLAPSSIKSYNYINENILQSDKDNIYAINDAIERLL